MKKLGASKHKIKGYVANYLGLLPFFTIFGIFMLYPFCYGITMSFTNWSIASRNNVKFVGLDNYKYILAGDNITSERFIHSLKNLAIYVPITLIIGLSLALIFALVGTQLNKRFYGIFRSIIFAPYVLPLFIGAGIWQWFMAPGAGIVVTILEKLGIGIGVDWANTQFYAILMVVLIDVWHATGFNFVLIGAGIKNISNELYEAADLDGATSFQKMRYITVPLLEPVLFLVITYGFISALQVYDIPWIISGTGDLNSIGGPGQVMLFPVMEMVRNVYLGTPNGLGRATAEGSVLMLIIMVITVIQFRLRKKSV